MKWSELKLLPSIVSPKPIIKCKSDCSNRRWRPIKSIWQSLSFPWTQIHNNKQINICCYYETFHQTNILRLGCIFKNTDTASRPTLCQHNDASSHYNKNDEKFGRSEEVLHIVCQFDTQTVDSDDQDWEDTRNLIIHNATSYLWHIYVYLITTFDVDGSNFI